MGLLLVINYPKNTARSSHATSLLIFLGSPVKLLGSRPTIALSQDLLYLGIVGLLYCIAILCLDIGLCVVADFFGGLLPAILYWLLSALIVAITLAYRAPFFKGAYMEIHAKSNAITL